MKAKLLRKIRKQYSIERVDELESDASPFLKVEAEFWKLPFYIVYHPGDCFWLKSYQISRSLEGAKSFIWRDVLSRYKEKFRHKPRKSAKVWWTNDR